ncbi:DMT family transporter [candidate division WWE3 bacterium]|uniref:DMT family transporter n=1 Tax=candidate division WWE3 bacterium TaxID=2053526 RepID=A0A955EB00_UNCKA|nr:DMT family transporter [candidate division WWE3 bacterium]
MYSFGILVGLTSSLTLVFRASTIKDTKLSTNQLNLLYRVIATPIFGFILYIYNVNPLVVADGFWFYYLALLAVNYLFSHLQVRALHKYSFSNVTVFEPLTMVFGGILSYFFLGEHLAPLQYLGMLIVALAFVYLVYTEKSITLNSQILRDMLILYVTVSIVHALAKQAVLLSSSMIVTFYQVFLVGVLFAVTTAFAGEKLYRFKDLKTNKNIVALAILHLVGFGLLTYTYRVLPLSIVVTLLAIRPFISLLLSQIKYREKNIKYKFIAACIAFLGVLVIAFG